MTKILSLGLVFCLLAFGARADECVKPEAWLSRIGVVAAQHALAPHVEADRGGADAKRLIAAMNAAPPVTSVPGDRFIVVSLADANGQPIPFEVVGFFDQGCLAKQMKAAPSDAAALISGKWPKAPGA